MWERPPGQANRQRLVQETLFRLSARKWRQKKEGDSSVHSAVRKVAGPYITSAAMLQLESQVITRCRSG